MKHHAALLLAPGQPKPRLASQLDGFHVTAMQGECVIVVLLLVAGVALTVAWNGYRARRNAQRVQAETAAVAE